MVRVPQVQGGNTPLRPIYQQGIERDSNPDNFGAAIGRGMMAAGQGLANAGQDAATIMSLQAHSEAQDADTAYANWVREASYGDNGFMTRMGSDAVQGRASYEKSLDTARRDFGAKLTGEAQKLYLALSNDRLAGALQSSAVHVANERKSWILQSAVSRAESFVNEAVDNYQSPSLIRGALTRGLFEVDGLAELQGWDETTKSLKRAEFESRLLSSVTLRIAQDDPLRAAGWLVGHGDGLSPEDQATVWRSITPAVKEAIVDQSGMNADGSLHVTAATADLLGRMPDVLAHEVLSGAEDEAKRRLDAAAEQHKVAVAQYRDSMTLDIVTGKVASEATILADPVLDDGDKATLVQKFRTEQGSTGAARDYLAKLATSTAPTLNPFSSDDRSLADKSFDILMQAVQPEQRDVAVMEFVKSSGMVPQAVVDGVRMSLASTDATKVSAALEMAAKLSDAAPMALGTGDASKEVKAAAATYDELVNGRGQTVQQAAQFIIDQRDPEKRAKRDLLKSSFDQAVKDKAFTVGDVLGAFGDNWMPGGPVAGLNPAQEQALAADYLNAVETAFTGPANGDAGIARKMALQDIQRTYGVSRVSGQEVVTKFPPENFYPAIGGNQDYIRALALKDARSIDAKASNVMLVATPDTAQDVRAGRSPRYSLLYQDANGVWDAAPGLFVVSGDDLATLSRLSQEEHGISFESHRARDLIDAGRKLPVLSPQSLPLYLEKLFTSQPVPEDDVRQAALADVAKRRDAFLGVAPPVVSGGTAKSGGPRVPTGSMSPDLAERLDRYQQQHGFGLYAPQ